MRLAKPRTMLIWRRESAAVRLPHQPGGSSPESFTACMPPPHEVTLVPAA